MRRLLVLLCCLLPTVAHAERGVHRFLEVAISPDGSTVADVEGDAPPGGLVPAVQRLVLRPAAGGGAPVTVALPCGTVPQCWPSSPAWSHDGRHLAFALRTPGTHRDSLYSVAADGSGLSRLLDFDGTLTTLRYGPGEALAVLAVAGADKEVGASQSGAALVGTLGGSVREERIGVLANGALAWASPPDLFVDQYDWRPDGRGFVGTAAHGDGDDNYWFARLYAFDRASGRATELLHPGLREQLADPVVSPDGRSVAFIGGLMSDFGATGGDVFLLPLKAGAAPVDLTPGMPASATSVYWNCRNGALQGRVLENTKQELVDWGAQPARASRRVVFSGTGSLDANDTDPVSVACAAPVSATVRQDFTTPPEIAVGRAGDWRTITHANAGQTMPLVARSLVWSNEGRRIQGWLLLPTGQDGRPVPGRRPMITLVHGGPAWASEPLFPGAGRTRDLLERGYAVFLPNPRGSFGQGEAFTQGNVGDFGHGDFRDIMSGIDAAIGSEPIDGQRLGITGGSYGGYMAMWAVTQTDRFSAAVALAGVSDWLSMYGESDVANSLRPYYPASIYADPAPYARSSPINFITHVHTPTAAYVGERDIECPPGQTEEFWHALTALHVPTEAVIYAGEGHGIRDPADVADLRRRVVAWFDRYLDRPAVAQR